MEENQCVIQEATPLDVVLRVYKTPGRLAAFLGLTHRSSVWIWRKHGGAILRRHCLKLLKTGQFTERQLLVGEP